jgi:hypothetical protein
MQSGIAPVTTPTGRLPFAAEQAPSGTLASLHAPLRAGERVELRAVHGATGEVQRAWFGSYDTLELQAREWTRHGYNVWYGINPRAGRSAGDLSCTRAESLPADIDAKLWDGDLAAARAALDSFGLDFGIVIASGGGFQPRLVLSDPLDLRDERQAMCYRALTTRLGRAICGADKRPDTISNPERILRVPNTLNWKYSPPRRVLVERCDLLVCYPASVVEAWLDEYAPWTRLAPPAHRAQTYLPASGVIGDFNVRYDPLPLLVNHGARLLPAHGHVQHLTRPGKYSGTSATYNYYPNTLIVFSEEWPPFSPRMTGGRKGYDPFEIFARLEYGGDRGAAYRAARALGYAGVMR